MIRWRDLSSNERDALPVGTVVHNSGVSSEVPGPPDPPLRFRLTRFGWQSDRRGLLIAARWIPGYCVVEAPADVVKGGAS